MDLQTLAEFVAGLVLLIGGAELLVRGASRLAVAAGISPLVVGLTIVSLGTSSPEIAVSLIAAFNGQGDLALGNVVGSNNFNILIVLGSCAVLAPLVVAQKLVRFDVPVLIGAVLLVVGLGVDGTIGFYDGGLLALFLIAYNAFVIRQSRRETKAVRREYEQEFGKRPAPAVGGKAAPLLLSGLLVLIGLALLTLGSHFLVQGAMKIATLLGVSQLVIGLTVVAAGTGLPEVAASIVATLRGQRDIAVGNVIGSNIYNLLGVLGIAGLISPQGVPIATSAMAFDVPVMLACSIACLPVFFNGYRIARWEGAMFLAFYAAYTGYLILRAQHHAALETYSAVMLTFVIPLTGMTLAVVSYRQWRSQR